jgi:hypothetical protein
VIHAVSSYGADQAFGVRILPRTLGRCENFFDAQCTEEEEVEIIGSIKSSVPEHNVTARQVPRSGCAPHLLPQRRLIL